MADENVAQIGFTLTFDGSNMMTEITSSCQKLRGKFEESFQEAARTAESAMEESCVEIRETLGGVAQSVGSVATEVAGICREKADSMASAMRQSWDNMEEGSKSCAENIWQNMQDMTDSVEQEAHSLAEDVEKNICLMSGKIADNTQDMARKTEKAMKGMEKQAGKSANTIHKNFSDSFASIAKKAVLTLGMAFTVKKIVDFSKECLELGSDLAEVQNVVDVTFPAMSRQVDAFAQSAAASFGLSETMAKQFTGTFGSMAKAFGFAEQQAYDMSTTLTGLAGDVASFYNISQDAAYTKLKSVFTGETESLKDLGIVMTQTALDSYALANGFGKTTAKMTEAEKVALRYKFVQEQLTGAAGDFARTSDGWANQVRILKLQFDSLKATIGQGLINVLIPVIKIINTLVGKLMTLANAFKAFTDMITGNKGTGNAAAQMQETAAAADSAAASTAAVGDAAAASARKMKGLFAFDSLNVASSDSGNGGSSGVSGGYNAEAFVMPELDTKEVEQADSRFQSLIDKAKALSDVFQQGFEIGFKNTGALDDIKKSIHKIKTSFREIFTSKDVLSAAGKFAENFVHALGKIAGSGASVGLTVAQNLVGGISKYLSDNSGRIKEYLINMFNIGSDISGLVGEAAGAFAYVFEAFGSDNGQQLTANIIGMFSNAFMGVTELASQLFYDVYHVIAQPFIDNKEAFRTALEDFLGVLSEVTGTIKQGIDDTLGKLKEVYDEHFKPFFDSLAGGLSDTAGKFMEFWNEKVSPLLSKWGSKFSTLWQEHLQPVFNKLGDMLGKVADFLKVLWEEIIKPFIDWIIANILPVLLPVIDGIMDAVFAVFGAIGDVIGGIIDVIGGVLDFLCGVFTGDWGKAWDGIVGIFEGVWGAIKGIVNGILGVIETLANGVIGGINFVIGALNKLSFEVPDWIPGIGGKSFGFDIPTLSEVSIPRLAEGAYVRPNTPQLAMIGDNRHQGEIVAPEDKIYQVSAQAMWDVMQKFMTAMKAMAGTSGNGASTIVLKVTGDMAQFVRMLKMELDREANRSGINLEVVYE